MPVITISDPRSLALGRSAFYFDQNKPRVGSKDSKKQSLRRLNDHREANGEKRLKHQTIDSFHHLSQDRSNGKPDNLFACTSADQHNKIELQSTELFTTLFNMGKVGFDYVSKKYFIACEKLDKEIKDWVKDGSPINWNIFSHPGNKQLELFEGAKT